MNAYEKLGVFYLGREVDANGKLTPNPILYESKDLTTHAVCVGMTGSGKTGLCLSLLEEAALDQIPAILIDPKGDLGNLMLTFPDLKPADFRPWIDESVAVRKGVTADQFAADTAATWAKGLASWDQDGERIRRLRAAADVAIYTPGGDAGLPLTVLRSFDAPAATLVDDAEAFHDRVVGAVSGLLVLVGIDPDPIQSREHILLTTIVDGAWRQGRNLDLAALIREVQSPAFDRVGVFDLESFFPAKERFELAMRLNGVLASPGFAAWMKGDPLDVDRLLYAPDGRPRLAILSIAHLGERERMFFVTMLLNEMVAWMRGKSGTSSLRALLYMDEVTGYLPPTANPPSKPPMMTLLKQARAYGLGVVLATQNPVDLDYKALSNTGTWFLGRLQTERDKERVMDGLEGASTASGHAFDRRKLEATLSGLDSRVFLLNNVHEDEPVLFHTRWAMSYLRGPLTRDHIRTLMASRRAEASPAAAGAAAVSPSPTTAAPRPVTPPGVDEVFLAPTVSGAGSLVYRPALLGQARLHYLDARAKVDLWRDVALLSLLLDDVEADPWPGADALRPGDVAIDADPQSGARFSEAPAAVLDAKRYGTWSKALAGHLYRERPLTLLHCADLKATSEPGESEAAFRGRLAQAFHEERDLTLETLRKRYATKLASAQERIRVARERVEREESQLGQQKLQTAVSLGATVLGALFGRKVASSANVGRASQTIRGAGRMSKEKEDIERASATVTSHEQKLQDLEADLQAEIDKLEDRYDVSAIELTEKLVRARKTEIGVTRLALAWTPWIRRADGTWEAAFAGLSA